MTLRSRHPAHPEDEKTGDATVDLDADDDPASTRISLLDIVRVIAGLLVLSAALSYIVTSNSYTWNYRPAFTRPERVKAWWVRVPLWSFVSAQRCVNHPVHHLGVPDCFMLAS